MSYYASPDDLPAPWRAKRIIIYAHGLKIYGQIPYILQRRLQAEFISNNAPFMGGRITLPSWEDNYTVVPFRAKDGGQQPEAAAAALLSWLESDKGYEWAVALGPEFHRQDLAEANWFNSPPQTFVPAGADTGRKLKTGFAGLLEAGPAKESE